MSRALVRTLGFSIAAMLSLLADSVVADDSTIALQTLIGTLDKRSRQPISVSFTVTRSCALSSTQLDGLRRQFGPYPDHPDRGRLDLLVELAARPEVKSCELIWSGPAGFRHVETVRSPADPPPPILELAIGGDADQRWMRSRTSTSGGQLTILKAGVPYPAQHNINQLVATAFDRVSLMLVYGLFAIGTDPRLDIARGESVSAFDCIVHDVTRNADRLVRLDRNVEVDVPPARITQVTEFLSPTDRESGVVHRTIVFSGFVELPVVGLTPTRIQIDDRDGVREVVQIEQLHAVTAAEVAAAAVPPTVDPDVTVLDFTTPDSAAHRTIAAAPSIAWTHVDGQDHFSLGAPQKITPLNDSAASIPKSSVHPERSSGVVAAWALAGMATVVAAVIIIRRYKQ